MPRACASGCSEVLGLDFPVDDWAKEEGIAEEEILERVTKAADEHYAGKREKYGPEIMNQVEKTFLLRTLDQLWRDHIITVEQLRQVIHLRGYGQRDPLNEYKTEGYNLFESMVNRLRENVTGQVMRVEVQMRDASELTELPDEDELPVMEAHHIDATTGEDDVAEGGRLLIDMDEAGTRKAGQARHRPQGPRDLGQGRPQRPLPLRLRQALQALPREAGLVFTELCNEFDPARCICHSGCTNGARGSGSCIRQPGQDAASHNHLPESQARAFGTEFRECARHLLRHRWMPAFMRRSPARYRHRAS